MTKHYWALLPVYILLQSLWYLLMPEGGYFFIGSASYYQFIYSLETAGELDFGIRMPIYPLLLWLNRALFGDSVVLVVAIQAACLWFTALMAARLGRGILGTPELPVFCLTAFNPFALAMCQSMFPDTVFAFFFVAMGYSAYHLYHSKKLSWALAMGGAMGLMALTRSNGVLLAPAFALAFLFWLWFQQGKPRRFVRQSLAVGISFSVLLSIWGIYNVISEGELRLFPENYRAYAINTNLAAAVVLSHPLQNMRISAYFDAIRITREQAIDRAGLDLEPAPKAYSPEQNALVEEHAFYILSRLSMTELATAMATASFRFFADPGLGEIYHLITESAKDSWSRVMKYGLWLWSLITRLLFAIAVIVVLKRRHSEVVLYMLLPIFLLWVSSAFLGYARYRLPVEPYILSLAVAGFIYLKAWLPNRSVD